MPAAPNTSALPTTRRWKPSICWRAPRASSPRWSRATPSPRASSSRANCPRTAWCSSIFPVVATRMYTPSPIVLMGYLNPVEMYGYEEFAEDALEKGVDGILMVDCPLEESHVLAPLRALGLDQILLASPTTTEKRLTALSEAASGFLYYVSFAGITGAAQLSTGDIAERVAGIRARSKAPVAVGFGVRDAA